MADENDDIKLEFIREQLLKHGEWLKGIFLQVLEKYQHRKSGQLMDSIKYNVVQNGKSFQLSFTFLDYGRFFDIQAYKKERKKRNDWNSNINKMLWGIEENREKSSRIKNSFYAEGGGRLGADGQKNTKYIRKVNKWYARTMYGGLGRLCSAVMYGLSDMEIARIKAELQQKN